MGSFFYPIFVESGPSSFSGQVEVLLVNGQFMLNTSNAMYSYGIKYKPYQLAFDYLFKQGKLRPQNMLLLGGAFSSALQILNNTYKTFPPTTIVEIDPVIIKLAQKYLPAKTLNTINYITEDAKIWIIQNQNKFDLIALDIFIDLEMPLWVKEPTFLTQCKETLAQNGTLVMNTLFKNKADLEVFQKTFKAIFPASVMLEDGINYIFIS